MSKALVIGNGESRSHVNIETYNQHTLIGCNAIHRDLYVNHLICCDRRMAEEAVNNPATATTEIYVRDHWYHYFRKIRKNKNIRSLPPVPTKGELKKNHADHWGSGGYAVLLAAVLEHNEITLIGFDLYAIDHTVNNVYKGTANYARAGSQAVDPSYWIYQIGCVFKSYPNTTFIIINRSDWIMPTEWQKNNVKFVAL
jgi:hypothetical protein